MFGFLKSLACPNERVIDEVMLFDLGVVSHDEGQASVHAGIADEVPVLHTVGPYKLPLTISNLTI